jgi:hypothetical protein
MYMKIKVITFHLFKCMEQSYKLICAWLHLYDKKNHSHNCDYGIVCVVNWMKNIFLLRNDVDISVCNFQLQLALWVCKEIL